jgi:hypothetical protein
MRVCFFTLGHSQCTLTSQLKKVAGLPEMGWLAERPLRKRTQRQRINLHLAMQRVLRGNFFARSRDFSKRRKVVKLSYNTCEVFVNANKNDSHYTIFHELDKVFILNQSAGHPIRNQLAYRLIWPGNRKFF